MKRKFISALCAISILLSCLSGTTVGADGDEYIIDNTEAGISYSGDWVEDSSGDGFYASNYTTSNGGEAVVPIKPNADGYYKLYARWPDVQSAGEVNIIVNDAKGEEYTVMRDQSINEGYWVLVGTYFFTAQGKQTVKIASFGGSVVFDALKLIISVKTSQKAKGSWFEGEPEQVYEEKTDIKSYISKAFSMKDKYKGLLRVTTVENSEEETAKDEKVVLLKPGDEVILGIGAEGTTSSGGKWKEEQSSTGEIYLSDGDALSDFDQFVKWKPQIVKDGRYEIYMRWPGGENRPKQAKVRIKNKNFVIGSAVVDQSKNANQWNFIGEYNLYKSDPYAVTLFANSSGITAADSIKVKFVSDEVQPQDSNTIAFERKNYTADKRDMYNIVLDDNGKFFFTKNGEIFNINGVCYSDTAMYMEEGIKYFVEAGGNMIRTYTAAALTNGCLDYAYERGIGVMAGIFIPKDAAYFSDKKMYREYIETQKRIVDEFKDHPALVMWNVNNESENADVDGEIYAMIEEISAYIKSVDSYHPIATAFAGCNTERQKKLKTLAPTVEILGMNTYSIISRAYSSSVESEWKAPIMVTEYGPNGTWGSECTRTSWNAIIEQNNDEKANLYRERHLEYIMNNNKGIGGFAFCLPYAIGNEGTLSWYAFVFKGMKTPIMDEMQFAWTNTYPKNMSPRIKSFTASGKTAADNVIAAPGETVELQLYATDRENDKLSYHFEIYEEVSAELTGKLPEVVAAVDNPQNSSTVKMHLPDVPGYYRIYGYVADGNGGVDVNNIPVYVKEASSIKNDTEEVEKLLKAAAEKYSAAGSVNARVDVHVEDNINGMPFSGSGSADIEADGELIHITSETTYQSGGNMMSEVYIGKEESWIRDAVSNPVTSEGWYDITQVYNEMCKDKDNLKKFTLDKISDNEHYILSADVFLPQFYPFALSGISSAAFMEHSDKPDAYSIEIYISKTDGEIKKAVAEAGYMRSEEKAEYRWLRYTYEYSSEGAGGISAPNNWRG